MKRIALGVAVLAVLGSACVQNSGSSLPPSAGAAFRDLLERPPPLREAKTSAKLYVSDPIGNKVEVYNVTGKNQQPVAAIIEGISGPSGMTVDGAGNIYVANTIGNNVTEYHYDGSGPVARYSLDLFGPVDVAVDSKGTVSVANYYNFAWSIVEFPAGSTTPSLEFRDTPGSAYSIGLAVNPQDDLYVSYQNFYSLPSVYKYPPDSKNGVVVLPSPSPVPNACQGQARCLIGGLLIDKSGNLVVADGTLPGVSVFPPGKKTPSKVLAKTGWPQSLVFASDESEIFVTDTKHDAVDEYTYPGGTLVDTIKSGLKSVYGVAVSPPSSQ